MEQNNKPLSPSDLQPEAPVVGQVDPSFFLPRTHDNQTTHQMHEDAIEREEILSGRKRMQQTGDGLFSLITDTSTESEKAQAGIEGTLEEGTTGFGRFSYGNQQARLKVARGEDYGALGKSASDFSSASWEGTGEYLASVWNSAKFWEDDKTVEYQQLEAQLKADDPLWNDAAKAETIANLKKQSPDLFEHGALFNTNVEGLVLSSKNELVFQQALHESIRMAQQSQRMETYNRINPHWYSNWAQPFRENVGEGLQDPGFMRDTMITTALTAGFGTAGAVGLRAAAMGGRMALAGRALAAVSREAVLLTGPTVGLIEGPAYRLAASTLFSNLSRTPRILASRGVAMFGEGAITGYINSTANQQHEYEWRQMVFGDNQVAFTQDTSEALDGAMLGGFVGIAATGLLRLGLDGVRVGGGMLTTKGRAHYAPRNLGMNFQNLTRNLADTFDNWAVTKGGGIVWGDTLSSGRGIAGGNMIDNFLRKNLDQRDFTKILVHGDRLWGQFDPHTVAKMNLDMASAAITARKFEEATGIAGEAAMRGAAGNQAALVFGSLFDEEQLKNAGLTHANVQDALDLYRTNGPSTRQSAAGAMLAGTTKTEPFKIDFDVHATNIGHLMNAVYLDKRFERAGVDFSGTLDVAESHLGRQLSFTSPSDLRTMENLGRASRGMVVEQEATKGLRNLMTKLDASTDVQMPVEVREKIITSISGGKTKFFVVDDTDPSYIIHVDTEAGTTTVSTRSLEVDPKTGEIKVVHDLASDPEYKSENIIRADEISNNVRDNLTKLEDMLSAEAVAKAKAEIAALKKAADADPTPEGKAKSIKLQTLQEAIDGSKPVTIQTLVEVFHLNKTEATAAMVIMKTLGLDENEAGITIAKGVSGVGEFRAGSVGQINFNASGAKALIRATKAGDLGTVTHEMGHYNSFVFLHSKASAERAAIGITEEMYDGMLAWAGATRDNIDLDTPEAIKAQEKIANGWSVYIQMALQGKTSGTSTPITRLFHKLGDHAGDLGESFKSQALLDKTAAMTPAAEAVFEKLLNRSANRIDELFDTAFQGKFKNLSKAKQNEIGEHILGAKMWEDYKAKMDIKSTAIRKKTDPLVKDSNLITAKEAGDLLIAGLKDHSSRKALSDFRKAHGRNATKAEIDTLIVEATRDIDNFNANDRILDIDTRGPRDNIEAANPTNLKTISSDSLLSLAETAKDGNTLYFIYSLGRVSNNGMGGLGLKHNVVVLTSSIITEELNKRAAEAAAKVEKTKAAVAAAPTPDAAVRAVLGVTADAPDASVKAAVAKIEAERALRRAAPSPATTTAAVIDILTEPLPASVPVERAMEVRAEAVAEVLTTEPAPTMEMLSEGGITTANIEAIQADLAALEARVEVTTPAENVAAHNAGTTTPAGPRETRTYVTEDGVPAELTPVEQASAAAHQNVVHAATQAQETSITQIATAETGTIEELVGIEVGVVPMDHMGVVVINARLASVAPEHVATAQATVSNLQGARDAARSRVSPVNQKKIEALAEMVKDNPVRFKQIDQILTNMGDGTAGLNDLNRSFFDAQLRFTIATRALNDLTGMSDEELKIFSDVHAKLFGKELTDAQESIIDRLTADPKNAQLIAEADKIFGKGAGDKLVVYIRGREIMAKANEFAAIRTSTQFLAEPANAVKLQTALEKLKTDPNDRAAQTFVGIHEAHQSRVRDSLGGHVAEEVEPVGKVDEFDQPNDLHERQKALGANRGIKAEHTFEPDWNPATAPLDINNPSPQFIAAWMMKNGNEGINGFEDILKRPNTAIATAEEIRNEPIVFNRIVELLGLGNVTDSDVTVVKPRIIDIGELRRIQGEFDTAYGKRQAKITTPSAKLMATFEHTNLMAARSGNALYSLEFMKKALVSPEHLDKISTRLGIDQTVDIFTKRAAVEAWARGEKTFRGKDMNVEGADRLLGQVQAHGRRVGGREDSGNTAGGLKDRKTTTSSLEPNMDKAKKTDADYDSLCQARAVMSFLGGELHNMLVRTGDTELADYLAIRKAIWGQDGDYVENFNNARMLRSTPQNPIKPLTKSQLATLDTKLDERIEVLAKELDKRGHHGVANMARDTRLGVAKGERETTMNRVMSQIDERFDRDQIRELATASYESQRGVRVDPALMDEILKYPVTATIATGNVSNIAEALKFMENEGGINAGIAKKLLEVSGKNLRDQALFGVLPPNGGFAALYYHDVGMITVNLKAKDDAIQRHILHEAIHTVTLKSIDREMGRMIPNMKMLRGREYLDALASISKNDSCPPGLKLIVDAYLQHVTNPKNEWMTPEAIEHLGDPLNDLGLFNAKKRPDQADYASLNIMEFVAVSLSNPMMATRLSLEEASIPNPKADSFGDVVEGATRLASLYLGEAEQNLVDSLLFKIYLGVSEFHNRSFDYNPYSRKAAMEAITYKQYGMPFTVNERDGTLSAINVLPHTTVKTLPPTIKEKALSDLKSAKGRLHKMLDEPATGNPKAKNKLRVFSQIRMENDLKVRANVEGEAGKDVAAVEKRLKDLQDTVESRRRDIRSLGLHEETEPRDLQYILSILNQTPVLQEPHTMDILDRMGHAVPETAKAFRAGKSVINLREMTDDDRREFVTAKMVPTIRRAMGQRITGSFSNSKLGKLSERMIGGAVDYANVANSDSVFLQFVAKLYDPSMDLRNAEIEGMLDIPSVDMANARLNNMYAKSGLMAVRDKALLVCKTDAELDAANNTAWKYLANRDNLPKDTPNRELVLQTIDAAIAFNQEVGELKVKHGLLKESNHLEYGTIRKASEYAYNNRQGFSDALHAHALKKAQDAAAKQGEVSLVTAEAMGWVDIRRETAGTDDITHVSIPDDSPLKAVTDLPKDMPWDSRARQAFAVMLPLLSAEAQKQHAEGLVSSKGYKDIWKQATGSRGDSHTALKETMEIAANRYLGIEDLMSSKSAKPRSERTMGGRMYNEDRILTHNEIASNPELSKFFEQNIFGLTHDTLRGDVTDLVMTDMLTDFFGGQVRMPMLDMIEMLNKTGEAFLGKHQLSSKQAKARQAGYNRVKTAWEHHTGKLTRSVDSIDAWYEELLNGARTAVMVASGLGATVGSIPELARAIVSSDSSRSGLAQLLPNLSKVVKLYNKRTAIQECASAAHWIRLMSSDNVLSKSDVMPTSPFHGLSYGGRDAGYFNGWKTAWAGVSRMNSVTDSRLGKAMNVFGLASKIPADMLRAVNSYTTTLHIWNAQLNVTRDAAKFLQLAEALQKTGPKDLAQFEQLAKQCGLRGQEALDLSTAGLLNPVHIKKLIEAGKDQGNYTDGLMDVRKLFDWAKKQDDPKAAEEAINKMGGYIGMTARRSNTEPTLLDVRVNQSAFGRAMNVFMQFLMSHSVQEIGRRRRYNGRNYGKHLVGLFLCEVAAGAMRGYKNRLLWGDDKETVDELVNRNPIEAGLYYATSLPTGGSYQWIKSASRQLLYSGYNAASGETVFKERFNMPKLMGSPTESAPSNIGRTAADLAGSSLGFMKEMMH